MNVLLGSLITSNLFHRGGSGLNTIEDSVLRDLDAYMVKGWVRVAIASAM